MKIRMLKMAAGPEGVYRPGMIFEVGEALGAAWVDAGVAEEVSDPHPQPLSLAGRGEQESTAIEPDVERAVMPAAKKKHVQKKELEMSEGDVSVEVLKPFVHNGELTAEGAVLEMPEQRAKDLERKGHVRVLPRSDEDKVERAGIERHGERGPAGGKHELVVGGLPDGEDKVERMGAKRHGAGEPGGKREALIGGLPDGDDKKERME